MRPAIYDQSNCHVFQPIMMSTASSFSTRTHSVYMSTSVAHDTISTPSTSAVSWRHTTTFLYGSAAPSFWNAHAIWMTAFSGMPGVGKAPLWE